jgi:ABC-2 type transport system ATP-binding protein
MIQVDNLTKRYGLVTAIHDVSFTVDKGRIVGFLGPNGAGKSTTMKILSCFMPASGGTARVAGYDVFSQSLEVRRRIGYLPENAPLYPDLSVASYLDFVAEIKGVTRTARRGRVADVMERCFIGDMQNRLIGKLSKGYRQRVGLAQALLGDPEVLILDEPTIGLDPRQIAEIRALIRSLAGQHTVILSTHILPEVSMVCDGVVIINRGRIVAQGTESELVQQAFPTARIELRVAGAGAELAPAVGAIPGVVAVQPLAARDGGAGVLVEAARDRDVRPELVRLVTGKGWTLQELHPVGMSLEEVFIRAVAGEQESPEPVAAAVETEETP